LRRLVSYTIQFGFIVTVKE